MLPYSFPSFHLSHLVVRPVPLLSGPTICRGWDRNSDGGSGISGRRLIPQHGGGKVLVRRLWSHKEALLDWDDFIESVLARPGFVERNGEHIAVLSVEHLEALVKAHEFHVQYVTEDDGSVTGSIQEIDLVANAPSVDELQVLLAADLVEYAQEYLENFQAYFHSPNRKRHLPSVLRVIMQPDKESVVSLLRVTSCS